MVNIPVVSRLSSEFAMGTFREFLFDGFVNPRNVWSKFNIKLLGILCSNTASGIFSLQVKTISSCRAGFISIFAVVPFLFSQSVGLSRLWAYLIDNAILPPSLANFWDILRQEHLLEPKLLLYEKLHTQWYAQEIVQD